MARVKLCLKRIEKNLEEECECDMAEEHSKFEEKISFSKSKN
jgi:hypothetical protein